MASHIVSQDGSTALILASSDVDHLETVQALLAAGADKEAKDNVSGVMQK